MFLQVLAKQRSGRLRFSRTQQRFSAGAVLTCRAWFMVPLQPTPHVANMHNRSACFTPDFKAQSALQLTLGLRLNMILKSHAVAVAFGLRLNLKLKIHAVAAEWQIMCSSHSMDHQCHVEFGFAQSCSHRGKASHYLTRHLASLMWLQQWIKMLLSCQGRGVCLQCSLYVTPACHNCVRKLEIMCQLVPVL